MADEMRLIDANKAKFFIADILDIFDVPVGDEMANRLFDLMDRLPPVDAAKVMHGRWLDKTEVITNLHFPRVDCSVCGHIFWHISALSYNYCPNCGAKMDGDGNG